MAILKTQGSWKSLPVKEEQTKVVLCDIISALGSVSRAQHRTILQYLS